MFDKFLTYVNEKRRQGVSDSQIARSLGMSLAHFMGKLNGVDVDKIDPPKEATKEPEVKPEVKDEDFVKPASGAEQPKAKSRATKKPAKKKEDQGV